MHTMKDMRIATLVVYEIGGSHPPLCHSLYAMSSRTYIHERVSLIKILDFPEKSIFCITIYLYLNLNENRQIYVMCSLEKPTIVSIEKFYLHSPMFVNFHRLNLNDNWFRLGLCTVSLQTFHCHPKVLYCL